MKKYTGAFQVYKRSGAVQISLILPTRRVIDGNPEKNVVERNGAIFLQVAKGVGVKKYDWENKIVFALGMQDIATILENPKWVTKENSKYPPSLFHPFSEGAREGKRLSFSPGKGNYQGTYMLNVSESDGNKVSVPFSAGEYQIFLQILRQSIPLMLGFSD